LQVQQRRECVVMSHHCCFSLFLFKTYLSCFHTHTDNHNNPNEPAIEEAANEQEEEVVHQHKSTNKTIPTQPTQQNQTKRKKVSPRTIQPIGGSNLQKGFSWTCLLRATRVCFLTTTFGRKILSAFVLCCNNQNMCDYICFLPYQVWYDILLYVITHIT
jgi:hypothetical protein